WVRSARNRFPVLEITPSRRPRDRSSVRAAWAPGTQDRSAETTSVSPRSKKAARIEGRSTVRSSGVTTALGVSGHRAARSAHGQITSSTPMKALMASRHLWGIRGVLLRRTRIGRTILYAPHTLGSAAVAAGAAAE